MLLFNFSRVLLFVFPEDVKWIMKLGIRVIWWKVVDLFENGVGVYEGTGETAMSSLGVCDDTSS